MLKFAFWNIAKRPLERLVVNMVAEHSVDVLLLAECHSPARVQRALNAGESAFHYCMGSNRGLHMFARLEQNQFRSLGPLEYGASWSLLPQGKQPLSVFALHVPSTWGDASSQQYYADNQNEEICRIESIELHDRSIVVGDFNMNPFDASMVTGFNTTMSEPVARRGSRVVGGAERKFFFNPMWTCLGQRADGPPGTYYFNKSLPLTYFWHALDQVLVRPSLLNAFALDSIRILSRIGEQDLMTPNGLPDRDAASDHLPIVFGLELDGVPNAVETANAVA